MAEAGIAQAFQTLATQMGKVSTAFGAQGVNQIVMPFEGEASKFKDWVKSIEKYAVLTTWGMMELSVWHIKLAVDQPATSSDEIRMQTNKLHGLK